MLSKRLPSKELELLLSSLPFTKDISTATPRELCRFLVWKDRKEKYPYICPVRAIDLYVAFANRIGIDLTGGFLFRPTSSDGTVTDKPFSSSAADARLKHYLREDEIGGAASLHSFRSGCAITLALSGTELQDIMGHVGWHNRSATVYYMQLSKVMSAGSPSSVLTGQTVNIEDPGIFYDQCNNLRHFTPVFPR